MAKKKKIKAAGPWIPDIDINDPVLLKDMWDRYQPVGSGPLSVMRTVCSLVRAIAEEKGIDLYEKDKLLK